MPDMRVCDTCSSVFTPVSNNQRFCCDSCRWADPKNVDKRRVRRLHLRTKRLAFIRRVKTFFGCSSCGYRGHPSALQFDHLPEFEKSFELSKGHMRSLENIKSEMRKCRILCANCHSIHTYNQQQGGL